MSITVSTIEDLRTELAGSVPEIRLVEGVYALYAGSVTITRDVALVADVPGSAVELNGVGGHRVLHLYGCRVQVIGLRMTGGYGSGSGIAIESDTIASFVDCEIDHNRAMPLLTAP